jgi:hypothetical protein
VVVSDDESYVSRVFAGPNAGELNILIAGVMRV